MGGVPVPPGTLSPLPHDEGFLLWILLREENLKVSILGIKISGLDLMAGFAHFLQHVHKYLFLYEKAILVNWLLQS